MTYERISKFYIIADRTSKKGKVTKDYTMPSCSYLSTAEYIASELNNGEYSGSYSNIRIVEG